MTAAVPPHAHTHASTLGSGSAQSGATRVLIILVKVTVLIDSLNKGTQTAVGGSTLRVHVPSVGRF